MQNSRSRIRRALIALAVPFLLSAIAALSGCGDADSHPSQMVKMREQQMADQRKAQGGRPGGMAVPSTPPSAPPGP